MFGILRFLYEIYISITCEAKCEMIKVVDASFVIWRGFTRYSGLFETKNTPHKAKLRRGIVKPNFQGVFKAVYDFERIKKQ